MVEVVTGGWATEAPEAVLGEGWSQMLDEESGEALFFIVCN